MSEPDTRMLLRAGDLIEDREVADVGGDRLSHAQIATQLAELVQTVPAPSNIALYGPWGSGKSGIGNLLREDLAHCRGVRFARFDAFKYAETPLRRNFVSAVAGELGIKDEAFHDALYSGHTRTDVKIPANKIVKILAVFAALTLGLSAILVGVVAIIAALQAAMVRRNRSRRRCCRARAQHCGTGSDLMGQRQRGRRDTRDGASRYCRSSRRRRATAGRDATEPNRCRR